MQHVDVPAGRHTKVGLFSADDVKQHIRVSVRGAQADISEIGKDIRDLHGQGAGGTEGGAVAIGFLAGSIRGLVALDIHIRHVDIGPDRFIHIIGQGGHCIHRIIIAQDIYAALGGGQGHMAVVGNGQLTLRNALIFINAIQVIQHIDVAQGGGVDGASVLHNPVGHADHALRLIVVAAPHGRRGTQHPSLRLFDGLFDAG